VTPIEAALVERIARGDASALSEVMALHAPALMRFATRYLRSPADADEVLQDVFLRAERALRRGTQPEQLPAWLFTITVNRCRSFRRRWRPLVSGPVADRAMDTAVASDAGFDAAAWREEIERALATLAPILREAFLLKHVEGLEYRDMTGITGASVPALKMRVARACEQLRDCLREVRHE
jgi:RNA polymerase sigma-70 factor (ECF subfamily)